MWHETPGGNCLRHAGREPVPRGACTRRGQDGSGQADADAGRACRRRCSQRPDPAARHRAGRQPAHRGRRAWLCAGLRRRRPELERAVDPGYPHPDGRGVQGCQGRNCRRPWRLFRAHRRRRQHVVPGHGGRGRARFAARRHARRWRSLHRLRCVRPLFRFAGCGQDLAAYDHAVRRLRPSHLADHRRRQFAVAGGGVRHARSF